MSKEPPTGVGITYVWLLCSYLLKALIYIKFYKTNFVFSKGIYNFCFLLKKVRLIFNELWTKEPISFGLWLSITAKKEYKKFNLCKRNIYFWLRFFCTRNLSSECLKPFFLVQNHILNLCSRVVNSQRFFCSQKADVKWSYLSFLV